MQIFLVVPICKHSGTMYPSCSHHAAAVIFSAPFNISDEFSFIVHRKDLRKVQGGQTALREHAPVAVAGNCTCRPVRR